jgi:hypothetical protein
LNKLKSKYKHTIKGENIYIDIGVKNDWSRIFFIRWRIV